MMKIFRAFLVVQLVAITELHPAPATDATSAAPKPGVRLARIDPSLLFNETPRWRAILSGLLPCAELNKEGCPRFYSDPQHEVVFVEICLGKPGVEAGLHIHRIGGGHRHFEWWDDKFNSWACNEGCNGDDGCSYLVTEDDQDGWPYEVRYTWSINMSEGYYLLHYVRGNVVVDEACYENLEP